MAIDEEVASKLNVRKLMNDEEESVTSTNSTNSNDVTDEGGSESGSEDEIEDESISSDLVGDHEPPKGANKENKTKQHSKTIGKSSFSNKNEKMSDEAINLMKSIEENGDIETSEDESDEDSEEGEDSEHESSSDNDDWLTKKNEVTSPSSVQEMKDGDNDEKSGWADAMAKVLNMGKNTAQEHPNKQLFLSKAIKDSEIKHRSAGTTKDKNAVEDEKDQSTTENTPFLRAVVRRAQKKELDEKGRRKPNIIKDRADEKMLCKLATKGIVQLFNAVREQQKSIKTQLNTAGKSVRKREKVYQGMDRQSFINVLTNKQPAGEENGSNSKNLKQKSSSSSNLKSLKRPKLQTLNNEIKSEEDDIKEEALDADDGSTWNVFRDDFMMGAKMKDWDKEESESDG